MSKEEKKRKASDSEEFEGKVSKFPAALDDRLRPLAVNLLTTPPHDVGPQD